MTRATINSKWVTSCYALRVSLARECVITTFNRIPRSDLGTMCLDRRAIRGIACGRPTGGKRLHG